VPAQSTTLASQNNPPEATISYDMSNDKVVETKPINNNSQNTTGTKFKTNIASTKAVKAVANSRKSGIFIQLGSFSVADSANKILTKNKKISKGIVEEMDSGDKKIYRALLGPIANKKKAAIILKQAKNAGYKDAFIVK